RLADRGIYIEVARAGESVALDSGGGQRTKALLAIGTDSRIWVGEKAFEERPRNHRWRRKRVAGVRSGIAAVVRFVATSISCRKQVARSGIRRTAGRPRCKAEHRLTRIGYDKSIFARGATGKEFAQTVLWRPRETSVHIEDSGQAPSTHD